jgi:hypothetical protein
VHFVPWGWPFSNWSALADSVVQEGEAIKIFVSMPAFATKVRPADTAEIALARKISNAVEASQRRGDMTDKRRAKMAAGAKCPGGGKNQVGWCICIRLARVVGSGPNDHLAITSQSLWGCAAGPGYAKGKGFAMVRSSETWCRPTYPYGTPGIAVGARVMARRALMPTPCTQFPYRGARALRRWFWHNSMTNRETCPC